MTAPHQRVNRAPEIKHALTDVRRVLEQLGIMGEGKARMRQSAGFLIRCPVHTENTPSCSVQLVKGLLLWKCHGCDATGDVLTLIAVVRGLNMGRDFRQVLAEGARLAGLWGIVDELEGRGAAPPPPARPAPAQAPEEDPREWPPAEEVRELWNASDLVGADEQAAAYMTGRGIDPDRVDAGDLARVLPVGGGLPRWARFPSGRDWRSAGFRVVVPMYSAAGELRSLRAWRITPGEGAKRLPPGACKASELVMADTFGREMLRSGWQIATVVVVEGEPDHLARATITRDPRTAVLGIVSGSWTQAFADKCTVGAKVVVRTDQDDAGDRYAAEVMQSVRRRCFPFRTKRVA
jgi:hypothetical protein